MLGPINSPPLPAQYPTAPNDDAPLQRNKRSIDGPQSQLEPQDADGSARDGRHRNTGSLDSLGKGNLP